MSFLVENVFQKLLIELRNIAGDVPTANTYYAMQYGNGYVGYYDLLPDTHGTKRLQSLDPNDPVPLKSKLIGAYVQKVDANPKLKAAADRLIDMGLLTIRDKKEEFKKITSEYNKDIFPTPDDVPDVTKVYSENQYDFRIDNTLKVDHTNKVIDLDQNYKLYNIRRTDPSKRGGAEYKGPSYVIPSGDVAFKGNELKLQKMLAFLMKHDPRLTQDYKLIGDEKYRTMTVGQLIKKPSEVQAALTGRGKLTMFHGTSAKRWKLIERKGLMPGSGGNAYIDMVTGWSEKNIYLTFDHNVAENYATRQAIKDASSAVVLKVEIPDVSKLVADEDNFGHMILDRPYTLQVKSRYNESYDPYTIEGSVNVKQLLESFGDKRIAMDEEGKAVYGTLMNYIINELPKQSLKKGTIAYRGVIPPKFIKLDMEYTKTPFKTPEQKGGPSDEEYDKIRKSVQKTAVRYDESLFRRAFRKILKN